LRTEAGDVFHIVFQLAGRPPEYLFLGFSLEQVDARLRVTARHLISSMLVSLLLAAVVGGLVYHRMVQPVSELASAAAEFGAGDLTRRVPPREGAEDEVALLAEAFNRMADQLQEKVTELESSREALSDEKARIQAILDGMMHGVVFYEPNGKIGYMNSAARKHWGWPGEDPPNSNESLHADSPEAAEAFECVAIGAQFNRHLQIKKGDRTLDTFISLILREGGGFLGIVEISSDITEQVASVRSLAHAEKMNVVGQLAAGVAHEINSPLDGAIEVTRVLERGELSMDEIKMLARAQHSALERIAAIVYRLLTFSRKEQTPTEPVPVWTVIEEAVELIKYRLSRSGVDVRMPEAGDVPYIIEGEALELSQVIVNLLSNAIDASPEGGTIKIEVYENNRWIEISVTDQGPGIPEESVDRIFTPFFTTKEIGKGTGLGLAVSKNILEQFGGKIDFINEEPPWGAKFLVHLPWTGERTGDQQPEKQRV
jgi:signal transduction histidine kinase